MMTNIDDESERLQAYLAEINARRNTSDPGGAGSLVFKCCAHCAYMQRDDTNFCARCGLAFPSAADMERRRGWCRFCKAAHHAGECTRRTITPAQFEVEATDDDAALRLTITLPVTLAVSTDEDSLLADLGVQLEDAAQLMRLTLGAIYKRHEQKWTSESME